MTVNIRNTFAGAWLAGAALFTPALAEGPALGTHPPTGLYDDAMMGYLLDTNIVSDFVRYREGAVARRLREHGEADVLTSIIVAAELRFSAAKRGAVRLTRRINETLARLDVLPLTEPVDRVYGELRARLERQGLPLDGNDLLIAAQALAGGHTLVTADHGFAHIAELACENWLARS